MIWKPLNLLIVGEHLIDILRGPDEPGASRILNQCIFSSTGTEGVVVAVHLQVQERAIFLHLTNQITVAILDPPSFVFGTGDLREGSIGFDGTQQRQLFRIVEFSPLSNEQVVVHLTEGGSLVNDTRTTLGGDEIGSDHSPHRHHIFA